MALVRYIPRMKSCSWFLGSGYYYQVSTNKWAGPYITRTAALFAAVYNQPQEEDN